MAAENKPYSVQCRFHENNLYEFYCKDCKDGVCFDCLSSMHENHSFCAIEAAQREMCDELKNYLTKDEKGHLKLTGIFEFLQQKSDELAKESLYVQRKIEQISENMKKQIDLSRDELLCHLKNVCAKNEQTVTLHRERVIKLLSDLNNLNNGNIQENDIDYLVHVISELQTCVSMNEQEMRLKRPLFRPSGFKCSIGTLFCEPIIDDDTADWENTSNMTSEMTQSGADISIQTEDENDSEGEWFDAEDSLENVFEVENYFDKIKNEYPITISTPNNMISIRKIIPISSTDAWVLVNKNVQKIINLILEDEIYAKSVDDVALLDNGDVLVASSHSNYVMKLLPNKRLVRFVNMGKSTNPHCLCREKENGTIAYMLCEIQPNMIGCKNYIVQTSLQGITKSSLALEKSHHCIPYAVEPFGKSYVCVLYQDIYHHKGFSKIRKVGKLTGQTMASFTGIVGKRPNKDFKCYGLACDSEYNILVSDNVHRCVYVLDQDLKFKKVILDESNGLHSPKALALYNNLLWIVDGSKILIFKYNST